MRKKIGQIELFFSCVIVIIFIFIITLICVEIRKEIQILLKDTEATRIAMSIIENINSRTYENVNEYIQEFSGVSVSKKIDENIQNITINGNEFNETFFGTEIPSGYQLSFKAENSNENFDISKNIIIILKYNIMNQEKNFEFSTTLEKEDVEECNKPVINDSYFEELGFNNYDYDIIPIKYSVDNKCFITTNITDEEWYNYSSKKWAKVLIFSRDADNLKDLFIDANGLVKNNVNYANIILDVTNYIYVWIPNFTIRDNITYFRYGTSKKAIKLDFRNYNNKNLYLNKISEEILDISGECSFDGIYGVWKKLGDEEDIYYKNFNQTKYAPIDLY